MASRTRGFTLAELLIASTITLLIGGATAGILRSTALARQNCREESQRLQDARTATREIAAALTNAARVDGDQGQLDGMDDERDGFPADRVRLFTIRRAAVRRDRPESDVKETEFFLARRGDELPCLMRRTDPTHNESPDGGGVVTRIAEHVVALDVWYFDGRRWQADWSGRDDGRPAAVRIRLGVATPESNDGIHWVTRMVRLPHMPGRESTPQTSTPNEETPS